MKTFSIGFQRGPPAYDETRFARMAARQFGTEHTELIVEPKALLETIEPLVNVHDGPFGDSFEHSHDIVSRLTPASTSPSPSPATVATNYCADIRASCAAENVGGASRRRCGRAQPPWRTSCPRGRRSAASARRRGAFFVTAQRPLEDRLFAYSPYLLDRLDELFSPRGRGARPRDRARVCPREPDTCPMPRRLSRACSRSSYETYLPYNLLVKADRSSMLHSLELRSPFLECAKVRADCAARLPDRYRRRGLDGNGC